ncbi:MAG: NAD-dependent succinate-semialdehyde dehydrogenase [Vicinamibacterales bacterium]
MSATFDIINPASGQAVASAPDNGPIEARHAAARAVEAFGRWSRTTAYERSGILRAWASSMMAREAELGRLMAQEMGKPITEARGEVRYAVSFVEWYAEEAKRVYGDTVPSQAAHKRILVQPQPVGPVYAITPWNFPAAMITRKAAPALAAGCTVVLKPAEQSPLTAIRLAELWVAAGGPADVFQVLPTTDPAAVSEVFFADPAIRKLSFTGSTEVGVRLAEQAARTMKRVSLELGGHAPFLIFADADVDLAVKEVAASKFRNAGQTCVCANRIYVHADVHDAFVERFSAVVSALHVGDPLDEGTQIGPLVDRQGLDKVVAHVDDAVSRGATAVVGGKAGAGLTFQPTVLTGVARGMRIMEEETFGPVAPVIRFTDDADAMRQANDTPFGLAAYLWTRDLSRAFRVAEGLQYGIVGVNDGVPSAAQAPFGGVKMSGVGREGGKWGIEEYLDIKFISIAL